MLALEGIATHGRLGKLVMSSLLIVGLGACKRPLSVVPDVTRGPDYRARRTSSRRGSKG